MKATIKPRLTEAQFTAQVIQLAGICGWKSAHFRAARTARGWRTPCQGDAKGWPDLVLVRGRRVIYAELKVGRNRLTPEQQQWRDALRCAGQDVRLWTDRDWAEITRTLGVS